MSGIELLQSHPLPYLDCNIIILIKIVHLEVFTEHFTNMLRHAVFTGPHGESEHLQTPRGLFLIVLTSSVVHLDVEDTSEELLTPALLCHKEPASEAPY